MYIVLALAGAHAALALLLFYSAYRAADGLQISSVIARSNPMLSGMIAPMTQKITGYIRSLVVPYAVAGSWLVASLVTDDAPSVTLLLYITLLMALETCGSIVPVKIHKMSVILVGLWVWYGLSARILPDNWSDGIVALSSVFLGATCLATVYAANRWRFWTSLTMGGVTCTTLGYSLYTGDNFGSCASATLLAVLLLQTYWRNKNIAMTSFLHGALVVVVARTLS
jgi:hypothetical protein